MNRLLRILVAFSLAALPLRLLAADGDTNNPIAAYRSILESAGIKPTGDGLLAYLGGIAPTEASLKDVDGLVAQLGAESFTQRDKAQRQLTAMGILAESRVSAATKSDDPEIACRAEKILKQWRTSNADTILYACLQSLAILKPDKAVPSVLGVIPLCAKPHLSAAAETALLAVAKENDLPALKRAIDRGGILERCIAVIACAKLLGASRATELDALLSSPSPAVRLATARAMANIGIYKAAGAFIDLMEHPDASIRSASFNCLVQFTKLDFKYSAYGPEDKRREAVADWRQWLAGDGKAAQLFFPLRCGGAVSYLPPGHTLIAMGNNRRGAVEFDADGKEVWNYPFVNCWSAERLPNGNTLLGSHTSGLLEVAPDKTVVWQYQGSFIEATPLDNGNVLAVSQSESRVFEIRKQDNSIVWEYKGNGAPVSALRLPNGNTMVAESGGQGIIEVTQDTKVIRSIGVAQYPYGLQVLQNGNLLIADYNKSSVFEWDCKAAKKVWEYGINGPTDAFRLPNGNTLVTNGENVSEVTPDKKVIRRWTGNSYGSARQ